MQISSSFNIFDTFVRLIPGCTVLYTVRLFCPLSENEIPTAIDLLFCIAIAYVIGSAFYGFSKPIKCLINRVVFGGNPRNNFVEPKKSHLCYVVKDEFTRELAQKIKKDIEKEAEIKMQHVSEHKSNSDFAINYMVNYLELNGLNGKEDKMVSLSDMFGCMVVVMIAVGFIWGLSSCCESLSVALRGLSFGFLAVITGVFIGSYLECVRLRYSIVVRTYYALTKNKP